MNISYLILTSTPQLTYIVLMQVLKERLILDHGTIGPKICGHHKVQKHHFHQYEVGQTTLEEGGLLDTVRTTTVFLMMVIIMFI